MKIGNKIEKILIVGLAIAGFVLLMVNLIILFSTIFK